MHSDLKLAIYKFNKFQNDIENIDLRSAYLDLMITLEALGIWKNISISDCSERAREVFKRNKRKGINIEQTPYSYGITHSELRGALVHGSLKKGRKISKDIRERELMFNIDPICPIVDLLVALNEFVNQVS